jgi:hypothetical protein
LHPIHGAAVACFFGAPLGAAIVFAINYFRLGRSSAAWGTLLGGVVITMVLFAIAFSVPEEATNKGVSLVFVGVQLAGTFALGNWLQGPALQEHVARGGKMASAWWDAGIGLLALIPALALMVGMVIVADPSVLNDGYGTRIAFGNDEIFIAGEATQQDAEKVADVLKQKGYFTGRGISARLEVINGRAELSLVFAESYWQDEAAKEDLRTLGRALVDAGFTGPATVHMCDETFTPQSSVTAD